MFINQINHFNFSSVAIVVNRYSGNGLVDNTEVQLIWLYKQIFESAKQNINYFLYNQNTYRFL